MRLLFFVSVVILTFAFSVSAQTPLTNRAFEKGARAARGAEFELAIENYRRAILFSETEKTSDDMLARIHFDIGVCLFKLKRTGEAAEEFTEAIRFSRRTYQRAFYALGMAQSELENWQAAETAFREAVRLKKDDGEAWFDLGLALLERENYDAAKSAFEKSIEFESVGAPDAHNNLGVIFALDANFPAAETEFKMALVKSNGESVEARSNLEFCKIYKRDFNRNALAKLEFSSKK